MNMLRSKELHSLMDENDEKFGHPSMAEIDKNLRPILEEVAILGPGNQDHPAVQQLYSWLVEPQFTGEEFLYIIQPLFRDVQNIKYDEQMFDEDSCFYVGKVAAEALAVRSPLLEGYWERAMWCVVYEFSGYLKNEYGVASECLTSIDG